jgi:formamidopyrimidine-DNA glycosylase
MPELPDIAVYIDRLAARIVGHRLEAVRLLNPFLLRTALPPIASTLGRTVQGVERVGKRVVIALDGDLFVVIHLMIAGRLLWLAKGRTTARNALAFFEFDSGTLALTEAGSKRRASLHVVEGRAALGALDAGGIDVLAASRDEFAARLVSENHTLKRALTDPRLFSGIGNAYSDEILHRARLSPVSLTRSLSAEAIDRLHAATRATLLDWIERPRPRSRRLAREGDRIPPADGGARPLQIAVPRLRCAGAAHRPRRERDELLRALPDRRPAARRPRAVAPAEGELAEEHRRHRLIDPIGALCFRNRQRASVALQFGR